MQKTIKPQLHQTHMKEMIMCWPRFVYRYGKTFDIWDDYENRSVGVAALAGTAVHSGVEIGLVHKKKHKTKPQSGLMTEKTNETAIAEWDKGVRLFGGELDNIEKTKGIFIDRSINLTQLYYNKVMDDVTPIGIEEPFVIKLIGYDFDLAGRIDTRVYGGVKDVKTKGGAPDKGAAHSIQACIYALAYQIRQKKKARFVHFDYLSTFKTKKGFSFHHYIRAVQVQDDFINPLYRRIEQFATIIELARQQKIDPLRAAPAADPSSWICTKKYCAYTDRCRFWSGRDE